MFGVHSAMPSSVARRLCPHAVFLDGRYHRYVEVSGEAAADPRGRHPAGGADLARRGVPRRVADRAQLLGDGPSIAAGIRRRVGEELHLTCSVGVGRTKLIAKLASKAAKPMATRAGIEPGPGVVVVTARAGAGVPASPAGRGAVGGRARSPAERLEAPRGAHRRRLAALAAGALERYLGAAHGRPPHRAVPGRGSTSGHPRPAGQVDRARGDVRHRPLGPR